MLWGPLNFVSLSFFRLGKDSVPRFLSSHSKAGNDECTRNWRHLQVIAQNTLPEKVDCLDLMMNNTDKPRPLGESYYPIIV